MSDQNITPRQSPTTILRGAYIRLVDGRSEAEKASLLREVIKETAAGSAI